MRSLVVQMLVLGLILTSQVVAGPLDLNVVSADAKWLAHLDVDAMQTSSVVQKAWQTLLEEHPDVESSLGTIRLLIGMDPTADIHGITIFDAGSDRAGPVTIVAASMDPQRMTLLTSLIPGNEITKHGAHVINRWQFKDNTTTIALAFRGREQMVLARSVDDAKSTLDVLDGKSPGMAADASLGGNIPAGTIFLVRTEGLCKTPSTDSFRMVIGEFEDQSFFRFRVTMPSPKEVSYVLSGIHAGQALGNLLWTDELGRKFLNAVQVRRDGPAMTILWSLPASDVWDGVLRIQQAVKKLRTGDTDTDVNNENDKTPSQEIPAKRSVPAEEDF